jgi:hypothetical protein
MNRWLLNLMTLSCTMVCTPTLKASPQHPQAAQNRQATSNDKDVYKKEGEPTTGNRNQMRMKHAGQAIEK